MKGYILSIIGTSYLNKGTLSSQADSELFSNETFACDQKSKAKPKKTKNKKAKHEQEQSTRFCNAVPKQFFL